jgi:hypothetical protein
MLQGENNSEVIDTEKKPKEKVLTCRMTYMSQKTFETQESNDERTDSVRRPKTKRRRAKSKKISRQQSISANSKQTIDWPKLIDFYDYINSGMEVQSYEPEDLMYVLETIAAELSCSISTKRLQKFIAKVLKKS